MLTKKQGCLAAWMLALRLGSATMAWAEDPAAAEEAEDDAVPEGVSYALDATLSYHNVDKLQFAPAPSTGVRVSRAHADSTDSARART